MNWSQTDPNLLSTITDGSLLGKLLDTTKGQSTITQAQLPEWIRIPTFLSSMETAGILQPLPDHQWLISGTAKVQLAMHAIRLGQPDRQILDSLTWQEFEEFVSTIFDRHNFSVHLRYRFKVNRRYEIDVIAARKPILFCIDCKHYGIRLGKSSALRNAVNKQIERTQELATHFAANQTKLNCLGWKKVMLLPLL
ncbi:MAG: restriction endonuclease, partial [Promethearchaeota archaeon]